MERRGTRVFARLVLPLLALTGIAASPAEMSASTLADGPRKAQPIKVAMGFHLIGDRSPEAVWARPLPTYVGDSGEVVSAPQLARFLARHRSPLAGYASHLVQAGATYGVDPRLVVAIAGVESSYGKRCRGHNAWGWNNGRTRWESWPESIDNYTRLLAERYPNWRNIRRIAPIYNPNTPEAWGRKVKGLMASIPVATG